MLDLCIALYYIVLKTTKVQGMENKFYLRSRHGDTGCNVMFHKKNGCGYGTNLDELHVFTRDEAQNEVNHDIGNLPLLKSEVDRLSIRAVDMQSMDHDNDIVDLSSTTPGSYALQVSGIWNGNDIYFLCDEGKTYNFDKANKYSFPDAFNLQRKNSKLVIWGVPYLETRARKTFHSHNINTRKMITGAGIEYKKPRKQRPTTGKTRGNCPICGRITWDFNPYENATCDDDGRCYS